MRVKISIGNHAGNQYTTKAGHKTLLSRAHTIRWITTNTKTSGRVDGTGTSSGEQKLKQEISAPGGDEYGRSIRTCAIVYSIGGESEGAERETSMSKHNRCFSQLLIYKKEKTRTKNLMKRKQNLLQPEQQVQVNN